MPADELLEVGRGASFFRSPGALDMQGRNGRTYRHDKEERCCRSEGASQSGLAPAPAPDALGMRDRAGVDGFAFEKATEVGGEFLGRGIAVGLLFCETLEANCFKVARHARIEQARRKRLRVV